MTGRQRSVEVYVDVHGVGGPALMGTLHAQSAGRHRAGKCGIELPGARLLSGGERDDSTFLVKRFDRTPKGGRRAFVSAIVASSAK